MTAFKGSALTLQWITPAGTLALDVDYRTWSYTPSIEMLDQTAGADTARSYVAGFKDGQAQAAGLIQAGSLYAYATALTEGQIGTIVFRPEGSAAGKFTGTIPAISNGLAQNTVYDGLMEWSCSWMQNGARSEGTL